MLVKNIFCFICISLGLVTVSSKDPRRQIFEDALAVWDMYRDPYNGFYCDSLHFYPKPIAPCGPRNNFYSSAGTGVGLMSEAIAAEYGYRSKDVARERVKQSLVSVIRSWPWEYHSGFLVHFTNRNLATLSEFSTIDTAELVLGALFVGNYFGGEVLKLATQLRDSVQWSNAIKAANNPTIYSKVDPNTGQFFGDIRPYNEYYLVAYLAMKTSPGTQSKAKKYFETYMASQDMPQGDGTYPVYKTYYDYQLLTDNDSNFMSSFIPQFCYYMSRAFQENTYYSSDLFLAWLQAVMKYWSLALNEGCTVWGKKVYGKVFGAGAGPGPSGYSVERIDGSPDLVVSAAIMAGFLPAATQELKEIINWQLEWLYDNEVCAYKVRLPYGNGMAKILWRCSVRWPNWHCPSVDSIDFSTMILGYATNFLPNDFYINYAA